MNIETLNIIESVATKAAEEAAEKTLKRLTNSGRVRFRYSTSFKKTEELLFLYPKLPPDNPTRQKIDQALKVLERDENINDYKDIIASKYFDGLTVQEISDIYDCQHQTITQRKNKMVKILARELFPEQVLSEILEQ